MSNVGVLAFTRSPLVSFLYDRGWHQNLNCSGFPGHDEEFKLAQEYFKPVEGGVLVHVSCGSGLFSRKFAKSGAYSKVVALDFTENMLHQCYEFIKRDDSILNSLLKSIILQTGDVFIGTAFLRVSSSTPAFFRTLRQTAGNYNYLTEEEIEDLCTSCGLINHTSKVQQFFIMFSAQKP